MGNCWPKPVASSNNTRPSSPAVIHNDANNKRTIVPPPPPADEVAAAIPPNGEIKTTPNLKMFSYDELRSATRNFRPDTMLGEGGFGRVFKGYIDPKTLRPSKVGVGMPVAVKKSNPDSEQGLKEWQAEVKFLGKFSHPNLVKLVGYCWEERQFLLVYEYMQRGSLESHLFRKGGEQIPWDVRIKIATGAARGLEVLHSTAKKVIYRDFKASNILLDGDFNAKLSDFGLAKSGPEDGNSHVTTKVVGTYGYAAPEYMATGHLYVKSDVYGFGVVLLEIITGLRVIDLNRPGGQNNLVEWALPSLHDKKKLKRLMDPRLQAEYPMKAAFATAELILTCLESDPKRRPDMKAVLESLEQISHIPIKPKKPKGEAKQGQRHHHHHHQQRSPLHSYGGSGGAAPPQRKHYGKEPRSY